MRLLFWQAYLSDFPDERAHGPATGTIARWHRLPDCDLVVSLYLSLNAVGTFVRGPRGAPPEMVYAQIQPFAAELSSALGTKLGPPDSGYHFHVKHSADVTDFDNWPEAIQWLYETASLYQAAMT